MFPRSTVHVMNEYVDNVCISEDNQNTPKENILRPLPLPYPQTYHGIVPGIISYSNTSHFILVFFCAVHA